MGKIPNTRSRYMRAGLRISSFGCLIALLVALCGENSRRTAQAGAEVDDSAGHLYVLSIGINAYPRASGFPTLKFAVADAQGVASAFSTKEVRNAFDGVEVATLYDTEATLAGVRSALEHLISESHPEDVVICYFAGMGEIIRSHAKDSVDKTKSDYSFAAIDSSRKTNELTARELSALLLSIQARRQIIILDTFQSSLAFEALRDALNADSIFTLRDAGRRFALFGIEGASQESVRLGHGLLTSALLDAMRGAADTNHDGVITEAELEGYVMGRIQDLTYSTDQVYDEQLLSYSDLRGLCLSSKKPRSETVCDSTFGYTPDLPESVKGKARGLQPEPSATDQAQARGTDYALIFAANTYDHWPKLDNPIYDAETLQSELIQNFGYLKENVIYQKDPTKRNVSDLLHKLRERAFGKNDRLLIYIAGHGYMNDVGAGFMVTRETELPAEDPYLYSGLNFAALRDEVDQLPVPHILLVLDVCYGGTFKEHKLLPPYSSENLDTAPTTDVVVSNKMKVASRLYIASGGLRQAYDGDPGRHSPFARSFLKTLRQYGGREHLIDMGKLDGDLYGLCPHPYFGTFGIQQEGGDFIFVPKPNAQKIPDPGLDAQVEGPRCSS